MILALLAAAGTFLYGTGRAPGGHLQQAASFTDKPWQLKELTASPAVDWDMDGKPDRDIFALLEHCDRDDILLFRKDHRVIRGSGTEKCDDDEEESYEDGRWEYDEKRRMLILSEADKTEELQVAASGARSLTLLRKFTTTRGSAHTLTAVYVLKPSGL